MINFEVFDLNTMKEIYSFSWMSQKENFLKNGWLTFSYYRSLDKKYDYVLNDIRTLKEVCGKDIVLKVILETCLLTEEEIVKACELSKEAGADFVKTSTGFSTAGAKAEHVALMRKTVGPEMGVKASGGIHSAKEAQAMIDAGASRLGTSATLLIIGK